MTYRSAYPFTLSPSPNTADITAPYVYDLTALIVTYRPISYPCDS